MAAKVRDIASYSDAHLIGEGGFGAVYRARDENHNRDVAIKVLPSELGADERRRFERERQTMGLLGDHPFVITVHESGFTDDGEAYIVMEHASGGSLGERVRNNGPMPWAEAAKLMAAVADAVQVAHDNGVLHRDIKPHNVLIDKFEQPKLADFGIAAVASSASSPDEETAATIAHASPELMRGEPSTEAADIYALGSSVFALIKGTPAFFRPDDQSVEPMIERIQTEPPPDLRKVGIPDDLATVIERAMAKEPADRFPTAGELAEALRTAATGHGPPTGPLTIAPEDIPTLGDGPGTNGSSSNGTGTGANDRGTVGDSTNGARDPESGASEPRSDSGSGSGSRSGSGSGSGAAKNPRQARKRRKPAENRRAKAPAAKADSGNDVGVDAAGEEKADTSAAAATDEAAAEGSPADAKEGGDASSEVAATTATPKSAAASGSVAVDERSTEDDSDGPADDEEPGTATDDAEEATEKAVRKAGAPPLPPHHYQSLPDPDPEWTATRIAALGVALAALIATVAIATVLIRGNDSETNLADGTATVDSEAELGADAAVSDETTVEVDCPSEIPINARVFCSIFTTNATSGEWHLPAFLAEPQPIEVVPGEYEIFVAPTNPEAVGDEFSLVVELEGTDGDTVEFTHTFTVVELFAEVECPDEVALGGSGVCRIVSYNATDGEWNIPRFGGEALRELNGEEAIFVEPSEASSVGQRYEITVVVRNAAGESYSTSAEFEVVDAS